MSETPFFFLHLLPSVCRPSGRCTSRPLPAVSARLIMISRQLPHSPPPIRPVLRTSHLHSVRSSSVREGLSSQERIKGTSDFEMAARAFFSLQLKHFSAFFVLARTLQRVASNLPHLQCRQVYPSLLTTLKLSITP